MKQHKVKGFTLIELMVVIGIIGVLSAVLIPSMNAYYTRSRIKTTNSNAKILFNAAQTAPRSSSSGSVPSVTTPSTLPETVWL